MIIIDSKEDSANGWDKMFTREHEILALKSGDFIVYGNNEEGKREGAIIERKSLQNILLSANKEVGPPELWSQLGDLCDNGRANNLTPVLLLDLSLVYDHVKHDWYTPQNYYTHILPYLLPQLTGIMNGILKYPVKTLIALDKDNVVMVLQNLDQHYVEPKKHAEFKLARSSFKMNTYQQRIAMFETILGHETAKVVTEKGSVPIAKLIEIWPKHIKHILIGGHRIPKDRLAALEKAIFGKPKVDT